MFPNVNCHRLRATVKLFICHATNSLLCSLWPLNPIRLRRTLFIIGLCSEPSITWYEKLRVAHARVMRGKFLQLTISNDTTSYRPTASASRTCRNACRDHKPAVATKHCRYSRRMRNPQYYVSTSLTHSVEDNFWNVAYHHDLFRNMWFALQYIHLIVMTMVLSSLCLIQRDDIFRTILKKQCPWKNNL